MQLPRRTLTRRSLLVGGAGLGVVAVATAAGWSATRGGSPTPAAPSPTAAPATPSPSAASGLVTPTPAVLNPAGEIRLPAMRTLGIDTFDSLRSGEPALAEVLGRTHSRIVAWEDTRQAMLSGDLAESWQQPDLTTVVLTLRANASWQNRPGLAHRGVSADDVVAHLHRVVAASMSGAMPQVQHGWEYTSIARVEATDPSTVVIQTHAPDPFILQALAGHLAFVQRAEAVPLLEADGNRLVTEHVAGSGPFILDGQSDNGDLVFSSFTGGHRRPHVAVTRVRPPATGLDAFLGREIDQFVARDRRDAGNLQGSGHDMARFSIFEATPLISSMHVGSAPWSEENLRIAFTAALNRYELAERLFGSRAEVAGIVPPSASAFARLPADLASFPGYRLSYQDDLADARERFAAMNSHPGPLTIDVPVIIDSLYALSAIIPSMLREALGVDVVIRPDSYVNIARRVKAGEYGNGSFATWIGWGPAVSHPDPARSLIDTYRGDAATAREAGYVDAVVDRFLGALATEFDPLERGELIREIETTLLSRAAGGVMPWVQQRHDVFRQPYVSGPEPDSYGLAADSHALGVDVTHAAYPPGRDA